MAVKLGSYGFFPESQTPPRSLLFSFRLNNYTGWGGGQAFTTMKQKLKFTVINKWHTNKYCKHCGKKFQENEQMVDTAISESIRYFHKEHLKN